ncbi:LPS-assembly lipoprotein [Azospirillum agricola]|uniref:LPS assembly lipoprotein LptE n=1 Tax=Azospirillum agricola TaxID=1720247 RepID=UPI001F4015AB|nr:LPS assembly lipoprotein LptE [Azospirillum agricola]MBP2229876.1 LPS-assembly lipoprotein [Azospirillum agricola]
MSSSDLGGFRRFPALRHALGRVMTRGLLALAVTATAACGFQPLYGDHGIGAGASEKLHSVDIASIPDREGQKLRNLLIDRFYESSRPEKTRYRLDVSVTAVEQKLALQKDASAVRSQLLVNAPYRLTDTTNGQVVFASSSRSMISYNILEQHYAGLLTVENAYDRALLEISNDITTRVAMHLGRGS